MKNIIISFAILLILAQPVFGQGAPLIPANFVEINNSNLAENTLLATDDAKIFIEFAKETRFVNADSKINFSGEILPPQVIELDIPKPRGMMEELVTFEMVSNSGSDIVFMDRLDKLSRKNIFRERLRNPDGLSRSSWVKLVYLLEDELISMPKLWEWQGAADGWRRIGGNVTDVEGEGNKRILSAILRRTGIYTIFDENPPPRVFADQFVILPPAEEIIPAFEPEVDFAPIGFASDEVFEFEPMTEIDDENVAEFFSAGVPPMLDYDIPSTVIADETALLADIESKSATYADQIEQNPAIKTQIDDFVGLINNKIQNKTETGRLTEDLNTVSFALARATTPEEIGNLEQSFTMLQTELFELEQNAIDESEFIELERNINQFFSQNAITNNLTTNTFEEPNVAQENINQPLPETSEMEEDFYIPENAQLTQSGGNESGSISLVFPLFLLVCFGLLGWAIWSARQKNKSNIAGF